MSKGREARQVRRSEKIFLCELGVLAGRYFFHFSSEPKQGTSVVAEDLLPDFGREALLFDDLLRMRPRARGMGIVGTKHHLVYIENAARHFDSDRVIDEADPDLPVEVFAREQLWEGNWSVAGESAAVSRPLIPNVEALHHARHPGKAGFGHYDLETWMAVEHAGEDKTRHRFQKLNPRRLLRKT